MKVEYKHNLIVASLCLGLLFLGFLLPFSFYDQDGYSLWYPIVSEYLKGDRHYHGSEIIFGGQNLASIYGVLPFWKLIRIVNPSIESFLNTTHMIFVSLFFISNLMIVWGIKKERTVFDIYLLFFYAVLSPVILNRVMAGHFNLLFGVLPFFAFLSLFFNKSILNVFFCTFCVWCALSTQAFQVLAYHVFYVPILLYFFFTIEKLKAKYILLSAIVFLAAFILNYSNFIEMYQHATNPENLRSINTNTTYTYTVSSLSDLSQFFFSGIYPEILTRPVGFFHEINYAVGIFPFIWILVQKERKDMLLYFIVFFVMFLFCMDVTPFNWISHLPLIKAFRVPQRVFMVLSLLLPLWVYSKFEFETKKNDLFVLMAGILVAQFIYFFEVIAFFLVGFFLFYKPYKSHRFVLIIAFASLFTGSLDKFLPSLDTHSQYLQIKDSLRPMLKKYDAPELRKRVFHFETAQPMLVNYVAQSLGINTLEGYGHPPAKLIFKFEEKTGIKISSTTNTFYLPNDERLLKEFNVQTVVSFGINNELLVKDL